MLKQTEVKAIVPDSPTGTAVKAVPEVQTGQMISPTVADSKDLMRKLGSRNASVRVEAQQSLKYLDVTTLLSLMASQRRLRKQRMIKNVAIIMVLIPLLAVLLHNPTFMIFLTIFAGVSAAIGITATQKSGAMALAQMDDLKAVGELIAALEMQDEEVQRAVRPALTNLLPRLRAQDSPLLNERQRRVLRLLMEGKLSGRRFGRQRDSEEETDLLLAALKSLEQVGDASFIPVVTRMAHGQDPGTELRICQAAAECLPYLEQCSANRQVSQEMLRASSQNHSLDADVLLRPMAGTKDASADTLLRPYELE